MGKGALPQFTSELTHRETVAGIIALVLHLALLPYALGLALVRGMISEEDANFALYAAMSLYTLVFAHGLLRRDFDAFFDRFIPNVFEIVTGYFALMFFNIAVNSLLLIFFDLDNPNTDSVNMLLISGSGKMRAVVIFLAPIVEEVLFRALIFGKVRKKSRLWAYALSAAAFSLYHLWGYIVYDARNLIYLVQYIPAAVLLCRCYERTNSIWTPIAMHALVNAVILSMLQ